MVEVSAGIILHEKKILICQRAEEKNCGLMWEFPGGKRESGESAEDCLIRECREELRTDIDVTAKFGESSYDYPHISVHIIFFLARITGGVLTNTEHKSMLWVRQEDLKNFAFCHADKQIIERLSIENIWD